MKHEIVEILLVEDNKGDIVLVKEALKRAKVANKLTVIEDGQAALDYLLETKKPDGPTMPGLILLDLNLPKLNGQEVLEKIKQDDNLKFVPVVIMTSSNAEEDILKAYNHQANCYVTKPVDFDQLMRVVNSIESFWLSVVQLPPARGKK